VDVSPSGLGRRQEPHEESGELPVALRDERGVVEVVQEQPREEAEQRAAPPVVDDGGDPVVVLRLGPADEGRGGAIQWHEGAPVARGVTRR